MGEFSGTVKIKRTSPSAKKKAGKTASKTAGGPRRINIAGKTTNPKKREAFVKELKKLAIKYKFRVTQK
jgi:hypothetical protein